MDPHTSSQIPAGDGHGVEEKKDDVQKIPQALPLPNLSTSLQVSTDHFTPNRPLTQFLALLEKHLHFPGEEEKDVMALRDLPVGPQIPQLLARFCPGGKAPQETNPGWPLDHPAEPPRAEFSADGKTVTLLWNFREGCLPEYAEIARRNVWRDTVLREWSVQLTKSTTTGNLSVANRRRTVLSVCTVRAFLFVMWAFRATEIHKTNFKQSRVSFDRLYLWLVSKMTGEVAPVTDRSGYYAFGGAERPGGFPGGVGGKGGFETILEEEKDEEESETEGVEEEESETEGETEQEKLGLLEKRLLRTTSVVGEALLVLEEGLSELVSRKKKRKATMTREEFSKGKNKRRKKVLNTC